MATTSTIASSIPELRAAMQNTHSMSQTRAWRIHALERLQRLVTENEGAFCDALARDLGKHPTEAQATELSVVQNELQFALRHVRKWMKRRHVPTPAYNFPAWSSVQRTPRAPPGVLIVGPYNFPLQLTLLPAIGSLAAGNPTLIKPSEICPATAELLGRLVEQYFGKSGNGSAADGNNLPGVLQVIQGDKDVTQALLQHAWGLVFFTGSARVGRLVAAACGSTLTPTVLELGGKCPAIVDLADISSRNPSRLQSAADRILWAKTLNAGQTCVGIDYLVVIDQSKAIKNEQQPRAAEALSPQMSGFKQALLQSLAGQFGKTEDDRFYRSELSRMPSPAHAQRLVDLVQEYDTFWCGGPDACRVADRYVAPTILPVTLPAASATEIPRLLREELFGPVLPVLVVPSQEEAVRAVQQINQWQTAATAGSDIVPPAATPLALYCFGGSSRNFRAILSQLPCASACHNDAVVHLANPHMPLAGLGTSGYGGYHGHVSFETFSHPQYTLEKPLGRIWDFNNLRCHPFDDPVETTAKSGNREDKEEDDNAPDKEIQVANTKISWKRWLVERVILRLPLIPVFLRWRA